MKKTPIIFCIFALFLTKVTAQSRYTYEVTKEDTILVGHFKDVVIKQPYSFKTQEEYATFLRYKRYAEKVYPYAVQAVKAYRDVQADTKNLGFFARRSYIKDKQRELKSKFEDPLINLSKGQGRVLIKMVERRLAVPMYKVIDDSKGSFTAAYWNILGNMNGYKLKQGYAEGDDKILDIVLADYNIPE